MDQLQFEIAPLGEAAAARPSALMKQLVAMLVAGCREEQQYAGSNAALLELGCADLRESLVSGRGGWLVAWLGPRPVGLVHLAVAGSDTPGTGVIAALYVLPQYRKRGVGRQLVEEAVAWARARGWDRVFIYVAKESPAVGFYARLGLGEGAEVGLPGYIRFVWPTTTKGVGAMKDKKLVPFMLKAVAVALGLGSVVLGMLKPERVERIAFLLGIGLVSLAISTLND